MYSKNAYIYPHASPSSHPRASASVIGVNGGELFLHHHHDMFPGHLNALYNQEIGGSGGGGVDPYSAMANQPCGVPRAGTKKDRHSKINTAQGPRDRRVRLSIGVARKFFDLQEILGFNKPSKTLDWLLTKSKAAIADLEQLRAKAKSDDSECGGEVEYSNNDKHKSTADESKIKASSLAKESRAKARARARERTREKMKLNETGNNVGLSPIQLMNNQVEFRKISASSGSTSSSSNLGFCEAATNEALIQESIVIKRKVKHQYPSISGFQQNLIISSSNYGIPTPYTAAAGNWDNICAILDHHKFINR